MFFILKSISRYAWIVGVRSKADNYRFI
jgi:hypothetical protein